MKMIVALYLGFAAVLLWGAESIAVVKSVKGSVQAKREGVYQAIKTGAFLEEGDIVLTGENSSAGVSFSDGTLIALGPKSVFAVNKYRFRPASGEYDFDVSMVRGNSLVETGKIGKLAPKKVRFNVPQGYIGIRGTKFIVSVEE